VDRRLRKGAQRFLKIAAAFQRFKVVAGQIHHMIRPCGEIGLHHRGSQIAKKRKIFELPHARGILRRQRGRCARIALLRRRLSRLRVVRIAAGQGGELAPHLFEALQQPGRKLPALAVQDHLKRLAGRDGLLVDPVGGKGVVAVRHTHGLRFQGDGVPPQSIRVSCAVPALVMRAADVVSAVQIIPVSGLFQRRQHFAALYGVILHPLVFCRGQGPGLIQNGVRNGYLSDVVHCRRAADHLDARLVQPVFRAGAGKVFQQYAGEHADALHMAAGLGAAVFYNGGKRIHCGFVGHPQLGGLLVDQLLLVVFVPVKL